MVSAEFQFARVEPVDRLSSTHDKSKKRQPFLCFDDVIAQINSRDTPFGETTEPAATQGAKKLAGREY